MPLLLDDFFHAHVPPSYVDFGASSSPGQKKKKKDKKRKYVHRAISPIGARAQITIVARQLSVVRQVNFLTNRPAHP